MFTSEQEFDEAVRECVEAAGFQQVSIVRKMGIPDHLLALLADEFDEDEGKDAPKKYQASCPYYMITTQVGTFGIAWIGPECPVLDLKGIEKSLDSLGESLTDYVYSCKPEILQALRLALS